MYYFLIEKKKKEYTLKTIVTVTETNDHFYESN